MASDQQSKKLDHGVRDMVSAIMSRIPDLHHKPGSSSHHQDDDERGVRVVTLAGNNVGASLKTDQPNDEKSGSVHPDGVFFGEDEQSDAMNTYVNSNFQAINNSIMMGGKYEANDPGVHLDITDVVESNKGKFRKYGKKKKNKKKEKKEKEKEKGKGNEKEKEKEKESSSSSSDDDDDSESSDGKERNDHKTGAKKEGEPLQQSMVPP